MKIKKNTNKKSPKNIEQFTVTAPLANTIIGFGYVVFFLFQK